MTLCKPCLCAKFPQQEITVGEITVFYRITEIIIEVICYFDVIRSYPIIFHHDYTFDVIGFVRKFYCFSEPCYLQHICYSGLTNNSFWVFLSNLTHIFLCLLYAFLSHLDLIFSLFPSCGLPILSSIFTNEAWLALTCFSLSDMTRFDTDKQESWKPFRLSSEVLSFF